MGQEIPLKDAKAVIAKAKEIYHTTSDDPIEVNGIKFARNSISHMKEYHGVDIWEAYEEVVEEELVLQRERDRIKDKAIDQEKSFLKE